MSAAPPAGHGLQAALAAKRQQTKAAYEAKVAHMSAGIKAKSLEDTFADASAGGSLKAPAGLPQKYGLITADELAAEESVSATSAADKAASEGSTARPNASAVLRAKVQKRKRKKLSFASGDNESDEDDFSALRKKKKRRASERAAAGDTVPPTIPHGRESEKETESGVQTGPSTSSTDPSAAGPGAETGSSGAGAGSMRDTSSAVSFLLQHDADRRALEMRRALEAEWMERETRLKRSKITVTYSYWDGSGHRRQIKVPRGATVGRFLEWVRQDLSADFPELAKISADGLLYVKEDLILPHSCDFHSLIESRARGKSGPLFVFDVVEDVRLATDHREEAAPVESHPGKVVERRWYEANKHVFPASRWELFDVQGAQRRRGPYTTHGGEVRGKGAKGGAAGGGGGAK